MSVVYGSPHVQKDVYVVIRTHASHRNGTFPLMIAPAIFQEPRVRVIQARTASQHDAGKATPKPIPFLAGCPREELFPLGGGPRASINWE